MAITYNKRIVKKDRQVTTRGPRDRQLALQASSGISVDSELVSTLKEQVSLLQDKLDSIKSDGRYSSDQVNEMMAKVVKEETINLHSRIKSLEENISSLKEIILAKDQIISDLKSQSIDYNKLTGLITEASLKINSVDGEVVTDRPTMETVLIDPVDKHDDNVEKHIGVPEESGEKEQMDKKVNKLKNLLGSLPSKK